jgi:hypothetical protein
VTVKVFRSRSWWSDFHCHEVHIIDPHRSDFAAQVPSKTAPAPLLRRRHQPEPFAETNEVLITPEHKVYHETMGYSDDELLTGRVPWKKRYDRPSKDVAQSGKFNVNK